MRLPAYRISAPAAENAPGPEVVSPGPKRRPLFKVFWGIIPLLLMMAVGGYVQYRKATSDRQVAGRGSVPIATVAVALGHLHSTVRISGTAVAEHSAMVRAPRVMGSRTDANRGGGGAHDHGAGGHPDFTLTLLRLAKGGATVKAGDVVAQFDPENQLQRLDDYQDSVVQFKNSIRKMMANLAATKEAHEQQVRAARAEWEKALLDLKTTGIRSQIDAEKLRLNAEETDSKYKQLLAEQSLVEESQGASIRVSELVLARAAIELERAENNVKRMTMTAPIQGVVVIANLVLNGDMRQIREGDQVSAGQPVLYVVDTGSMVLSGTVNQVDAERMRLGTPATVRLDAYPEFSASGTVIGVGAMAKVSSFRAGYVAEIPVRLRIHGRHTRLLPDLTASAEVEVDAEENVLLAPRPSLFKKDGQSFVAVQNRAGWTRREIVTGLHNATHVAVRAGLQPGELVALQWPL